MSRRLRAVQLSELISSEFEKPKSFESARKSFKKNPTNKIAEWVGLNSADKKRLKAMPRDVQAVLVKIINTMFGYSKQILENEGHPGARPLVLRTMVTSIAMVIITIIDWALGNNGELLPTGTQPNPDMDCLEAGFKEMIAEMELEFASNDLANCLAMVAFSSIPMPIPGPLNVPQMTDCYNDLLSFNGATRRFAAAQDLRIHICTKPASV